MFRQLYTHPETFVLRTDILHGRGLSSLFTFSVLSVVVQDVEERLTDCLGLEQKQDPKHHVERPNLQKCVKLPWECPAHSLETMHFYLHTFQAVAKTFLS